MAGIISSSYYLPEQRKTVSDFLKQSRFDQAKDPDFIECFISQSGLRDIHVEPEKNQIEIFTKILDDMFYEDDIPVEEIDYLIYTSPENWMMKDICIPYYLQTYYDWENITIIGMFQECVATLQAIQMAGALVDSGIVKNVLILSICYGWEDSKRYTGSTIVGDGAGAFLVGKEGVRCNILGGNSNSNGKYSFCKYNNMNADVTGLDLARHGSSFILNYLHSQNCRLEDMKMIIPQNISYSEYHMYSRYLDMDMNKFFLKNLPSGGHLAEVDMVRNYTDVMRSDLLKEGEKALLFGTGTVEDGMDMIFNCLLVEKNKSF